MRVAVVQLNYKVGAIESNLQKILNAMREHQHKVDLICFSELCLIGYYPQDLIERPGFFQAQQRALEQIVTLSRESKALILLGALGKNQAKGKPFYNSCAVIHQGEVKYCYHKRLLPVYNIFDEARHFEAGREALIFEHLNKKIAILICEDGWQHADISEYTQQPVTELETKEIDVIFCLNASPSNIDKQQARLDCFSKLAIKCNSNIVYVNQVGGNDEIVYDGCSFIIDQQGITLGCLESFKEEVGIFDLHAQISLKENFQQQKILEKANLLWQQCQLGLADYVKKCAFEQVVIAVSGGIDSAVTLVQAVQAVGADNIMALYMPSGYSSQHSQQDAQQLCKNHGVKLIEYSIEKQFRLALHEFEQNVGEVATEITRQNIQARIRGRIAMEVANQKNALLLSTSNKSEMSVGYSTLYGDMCGGLNVIGDLYKTDIYEIADFYNHTAQPGIPQNILVKAPSAELAPEQLDEDSLPPYPILDAILKLYIEGELLNDQERQDCQRILLQQPKQLICEIQKRVDNAEYKRRQASPVIRVRQRAFGMGRQLPMAAEYPPLPT